ncbi:MAG TPA: hypothetical protein PK328_04955 [Chitinophagaceae bacterium]|nr:hypothetical protein [Chitinophagaceae bacterium]
MKNFLTVFFISLTLVSLGQKTQSVDKDKERIDKVCDTFMKTFAEGKTADALQLLKKNSLISHSSIDTLLVTIEGQMEVFIPAYGNIRSAEFVSERKIKDFAAKRYYVLKLENYYLKFEFALYKTINGWSITNFKYDEDMTELFK